MVKTLDRDELKANKTHEGVVLSSSKAQLDEKGNLITKTITSTYLAEAAASAAVSPLLRRPVIA